MMNSKHTAPWQTSLRRRIGVIILIAASISTCAYLVMMIAGSALVSYLFSDTSSWEEKTALKAEELQEFVTDNNLAKADAGMIEDWRKSNAAVYVYIYDGDTPLYETYNDSVMISDDLSREIIFADGTADLNMFYALDYKYYNMATLAEVVVSLILFFLIVTVMLKRIVGEIQELERDVKILEGGGLDHVVEVRSRDELGSLEKSIDDMRKALQSNIEREEELTRANNELVTRMAHDLRTPLTSLLLYLDLISERKYDSEEQLGQYISVARSKAEGIRTMSNLLFERFLVTGDSKVDTEAPELARYALEDPLSAFIMSLELQGFNISSDIIWPEVCVSISMIYVNRILENIGSNIMKYADRTVPVIIGITGDEMRDEKNPGKKSVKVSIRNTIGNIGNLSKDTSNIGLENIRLMMEKMGGSLETHDDGNTFDTVLYFPVFQDGELLKGA